MNKAKTLFGTLLACSLLLVGCNKSNSSTSENSGSNTSTSTSQASVIEQMTQKARSYLEAQNITLTYITESLAYGHSQKQTNVMEIDGDKMHYVATSETDGVPGAAQEGYYEIGDVIYEYRKIDSVWQKQVSDMPVRPTPASQLYGLDTIMAKLVQSATFSENYWTVENVTVNLNAKEIAIQVGSSMATYDFDPATFNYTYDYVKLGVSEGNLATIEVGSHPITFDGNVDTHIAHAEVLTGINSKVTLSNFQAVGTTSVTLPVISA